MNCADAALDDADADFQRWFFGGTPPDNDGWDRHAFENALHETCAVSDSCEFLHLEPAHRASERSERLLAA